MNTATANPKINIRLPEDGSDGALLGRVWLPGETPGPALVRLDGETVQDITAAGPTAAELLNASDPLARLGTADGRPICSVEELLDNSRPERLSADLPYLLAPVDLQVIKASGVTFTASLMERVIEEQARGEPARAGYHRCRSDRGRTAQRIRSAGPSRHSRRPADMQRGGIAR